MKKLFIALVAIASFTSCKKENTVNIPVVPQESGFVKNIKSITSVYNGGAPELYTYSFDVQGRITSHRSEYPGMVRAMDFDYTTAGKIVATRTDNSVIKNFYECTTNDKGYITNMILKNAAGGLLYTYKYTYDNNGYIVKVEWTDALGSMGHRDITIQNGNITESKLYHNGVLSGTTTFTYDLTKYNSIKSAYGSNWEGTSFGKATKNLVTNSKVTNSIGVVTWNQNVTYQVNAAGYLEKSNFTNLINNAVGESTYIFQ